MSFDDLPPLPRMIHEEANAYADAAIALSKRAVRVCTTDLDQAYGADYWQKVDIFVPAGAEKGRLPVFGFIHGGAWLSGCKEWLGFMAPTFIGAPCVFVAISYRKAPQCRMAGQLADIGAALRWIVDNAPRFGADPKRVFIGGHSAGGHLAALAVLHPNVLPVAGVAADCIAGVLPLSAPFDLRNTAENFDETLRRVHQNVLERPEEAEAFSPITYVNRARVPFLLGWGENDFPRTKRQNVEMLQALKSQGAIVTGVELAGASHFDAHLRSADARDVWVGQAISMLQGHLR